MSFCRFTRATVCLESSARNRMAAGYGTRRALGGLNASAAAVDGDAYTKSIADERESCVRFEQSNAHGTDGSNGSAAACVSEMARSSVRDTDIFA